MSGRPRRFRRERAGKPRAVGYVALAVDMYGGGAITSDREEAGKRPGPCAITRTCSGPGPRWSSASPGR